MSFEERQVKGIARCLADTGVAPEKLRIHIFDIAPGTRVHPPHTHDAVEAFYILEGHGVVEVGDEHHAIGPNEALILDARTMHGMENSGNTPMRCMVIIAPA